MTIDPGEQGMFAAAFDGLAVGDAHAGEPRTISQRDVEIFAGLTGDHHPVHVDPEWAASGPFGGPIVHGLLIVSCVVGSLPLDPGRIVALRRIEEVVFKRPLPVDGAISARCEVADLKPLDATSGLVSCRCRIVDEQERLIARATLGIIWRRDPDHQDELASVLVDGAGTRVLL